MSETNPRRPERPPGEPSMQSLFGVPGLRQWSPQAMSEALLRATLATPSTPPPAAEQQPGVAGPAQAERVQGKPSLPALPPRPMPQLPPSRLAGYRPAAPDRPRRRLVDELPALDRQTAEQDLLKERRSRVQRACQYLNEIGRCPKDQGCVLSRYDRRYRHLP